MRHVDHQISSRFIGNLAETGKVYLPRVGGTAGDDQFGLMFFGQPFDFVIINQTVFFAYAVLYGVQPFAGNGNFGAVSQMPAGVERHAENGVTGWLKLADYTYEEAWATFNDLMPYGG